MSNYIEKNLSKDEHILVTEKTIHGVIFLYLV